MDKNRGGCMSVMMNERRGMSGGSCSSSSSCARRAADGLVGWLVGAVCVAESGVGAHSAAVIIRKCWVHGHRRIEKEVLGRCLWDLAGMIGAVGRNWQ